MIDDLMMLSFSGSSYPSPKEKDDAALQTQLHQHNFTFILFSLFWKNSICYRISEKQGLCIVPLLPGAEVR